MTKDQEIVEKVLSLLRTWGWEAGLEKLKAEIRNTSDLNDRASLHYFVAWMLAERGAHQEAIAQFQAIGQLPAFAALSFVAQAYVAMRENAYPRAHQLLDQATAKADLADSILTATIAHCRGTVFYHEGKSDLALPELHAALKGFGLEHFGTGRALDTFGMVYANKDNFHAAREFYEKAIEYKQLFKDDAGIALTNGQLGRLYLDWGNLDKAEEHFEVDLKIAQRIHDPRGEAQMYNALGQVALAREEWQDAAELLDESIYRSEQGKWSVNEGYARKDRALAHLGQGELQEAEEQAQRAQELFVDAGFAEGMAHTKRAWALVRRAQGNHDEAERLLISALAHFDAKEERAEAARAQLEFARTLKARNAGQLPIRMALLDALDRAERCRRDMLVREIERELKSVDEVALARHIYARARGCGIREDTTSLLDGSREPATVMFLDVQGSTEYARTQDPEDVMMTLNQMMADFAAVLERHNAKVTAYLGDGFMALVRGVNHARSAVTAAISLVESLKHFNEPREVLGLKPLNVRIGISTGEVFIGNVGTYQKMDFTAIGTTANLAARIQSEAEPGLLCISRGTYEQVREHFVFKEDNPRTVSLKGLGEQEVWDVVGIR